MVWIANEICPEYLPSLHKRSGVRLVACEDARELAIGAGPSVIITNPPFVYSEDILIRCLTSAPDAITIFLQRIGWAGGPRAEVVRHLRPSVYQLPQRPSFKDVVTIDEKTGKQKKSSQDSTEYAWFVFDGLGRYEMLGDTPDEVRRAEKAERRAAKAAEQRAISEWKMSGCEP